MSGSKATKLRKRATITERVAAQYRTDSNDSGTDSSDTPSMTQLSGKPGKARLLAQTALRAASSSSRKAPKRILKSINTVISPQKGVNIIKKTSLKFPGREGSKQSVSIQEYLKRVEPTADQSKSSSQKKRALWHESTRIPSDLCDEDFISLHDDIMTASQNSVQIDKVWDAMDSKPIAYESVNESIDNAYETVNESIDDLYETINDSQDASDERDDHAHDINNTGGPKSYKDKNTTHESKAGESRGCIRQSDNFTELISDKNMSQISDSEDDGELIVDYVKSNKLAKEGLRGSHVPQNLQSRTVVLLSSSPAHRTLDDSWAEFDDDQHNPSVIEIPDSQGYLLASLDSASDVLEIPESPGNPLGEVLTMDKGQQIIQDSNRDNANEDPSRSEIQCDQNANQGSNLEVANENAINSDVLIDHYTAMTTTELRQLIRSWGFRPVRSRDKMLELVRSVKQQSSQTSENPPIVGQTEIRQMLYKRISTEIKTNQLSKEWWHRILFYEPIVIEQFAEFLKSELRIDVNLDTVKDWCDYTGVIFTYEKVTQKKSELE
jgi:Slx4 endonuclease